MTVSYACNQCDRPVRSPFDEGTKSLACMACGDSISLPDGAVRGKRLTRCLVCPSHDLYVRKDMPQRLGVLIVIIGAVGSSIAWGYGHVMWTFAILFATALIDLILYLVIGDCLMCYRCHAQYRNVENLDTFPAFDLETHERHRQLSARLTEK